MRGYHLNIFETSLQLGYNSARTTPPSPFLGKKAFKSSHLAGVITSRPLQSYTSVHQPHMGIMLVGDIKRKSSRLIRFYTGYSCAITAVILPCSPFYMMGAYLSRCKMLDLNNRIILKISPSLIPPIPWYKSPVISFINLCSCPPSITRDLSSTAVVHSHHHATLKRLIDALGNRLFLPLRRWSRHPDESLARRH